MPRLKKLSAYYDRQFGLDDAVFARTNAVLAEAVSGGRHRTRAELSAALDAAGIPASGQRAGNIMMRAEFDEVVISGAPKGKQQTYAAFDERVPPDPGFDVDESLAQLARRFFTDPRSGDRQGSGDLGQPDPRSGPTRVGAGGIGAGVRHRRGSDGVSRCGCP